MSDEPLAYIYRWNNKGRKGQHCAVPIRTKSMNSCLVRFADGHQMVTSRNAIRKARPDDPFIEHRPIADWPPA